MSRALTLNRPVAQSSSVLIAAGLLVALALVVFADVPSTTRLARELQNAAHAPAFAVIAWLLVKAMHPLALPFARTYACAFGLALLLAGGTEAIQYLLARDASWTDLARDLAGTTIALCLLASFDEPVSRIRRARQSLWIAAVAIGLVTLASLGWSIAAYIHRARQFPTLVAFDSKLDGYFIHVHGAGGIDRTRGGAYVRLAGTDWPGVVVEEPSPDWSGFAVLAIRVSNPSSQNLTLTLRIHDALHNKQFEDRLNRTFALPAATATLWRVPLADVAAAPRGRVMDLTRIAEMQLFSTPSAGAFVLHGVWLER